MSNREIFIDKLRQLSKEEMLERYVALLNTERLTDYVADLEAKLEESEKKIYELQTKLNLKEYAPAFCSLAGRDCEILGKVDQLKQKLAEKEKEIEKLSTIIEVKDETTKHYRSWLDELNHKLNIEEPCLLMNYKDMVEKLTQSQNQTAIDELEKVKEIILEERKITAFKFDTFNKGKDTGLYWINEQIDNQIKALKENK